MTDSNIYRYSNLGQTLAETLKDLDTTYGIQPETTRLIFQKFDEVSILGRKQGVPRIYAQRD